MSAVKVCHFCGKRSIDFSNIQNFFFHVKSHQSVPTNCCICDKTYKLNKLERQYVNVTNKADRMFVMLKEYENSMYILNNSETWINIDENAIEKLEKIQNTICRSILSIPISTPASFILWELGLLTMENRIIKKKLTFYHHLINLPDEALAKQMMNVQLEHQFPGLVKECLNYLRELKLENVNLKNVSKTLWKKEVKKAIKIKNEKELRRDIGKLEKVKEYATENFQQKRYFKDLNLDEARAIFKHRSKMTQYTKWNFKNDPQYRNVLWKCSSCKTNIDTQSHLLWCESYKKLRENKDLKSDKDLATYLMEVFKIRTKINTKK